MDGYAPAYVAHNIPFLVVSGLDTLSQNEPQAEERGIRIASEIPVVDTEDAKTLRTYFRQVDGADLAWNGREHQGRNKFKIKNVGRVYTLPSRTAQLHAPSARLPSSRDVSPSPRPIAHSPLSPLSPGSSIYPDGLLDSKWVEKHQEEIPSAFVSFYSFTSDSNLSTLHDNQLKTDINNIKSMLARSGYKVRLVVALLSEASAVKSADVEDRLANIRRATGLDAKTSLFFLPPQSSAVELQAFVETILSTIYPSCIEYYRDLSKHSRRKRNRGSNPPSSPPLSVVSQSLSSQSWIVRYDFKLGVFAEFRQEMDAAVRSFESGYESLLGPEVLEAIASWNHRWNEARLLADVFAIRILRCLLWNGHTTAAVRRWQLHRERMRSLVDRRGKGSSTYGWEAWEARWATVMGEMIKKVALAELALETASVYLQPEKSITIGERLEPWEFLHHPGYWFRLAAQHLINRRTLALRIPEEDRHPPESSPTPQSRKPSQVSPYDTYLCPEPHEEYPGPDGVDHSLLIIRTLSKAIPEYEKRRQNRLVNDLCLQSAKESMRREDWDSALHILRPLWQKMSFRREGWWDFVEEISWALRKAAANAGDGGTVVSVDWELQHKCFLYRSGWHYDLSQSLNGLDTVKSKPAVVLHDQDIHSFLSATYTFEQPDGKVGELCTSQLAVTSDALSAAAPITVSEIRINFEGSMRPFILRHQENQDGKEGHGRLFTTVALSDSPAANKDVLSGRPALLGMANLTFSPGKTRVFEMKTLPREAGEVSATSVQFSVASDLYDLDYVQKIVPSPAPDLWWGESSVVRKISRPNTSLINILPKPPKVELICKEIPEQYYTNEPIELNLEVLNGEDVESIIELDVRFLGDNRPPVTLRLASAGDVEAKENSTKLEMGKLASSASSTVHLLIPPINLPSIYDLTIKASYHLATDLETLVTRSLSTQFQVINPFEANYDFSPRIHPAPWPSFFSHTEGEDREPGPAYGLAQKWCLTARYFSFAAEDLLVSDLAVAVIGTNGAITASAEKTTVVPDSGVRVSPKSLDEAEFHVFTQKLSLDDRGTATLDVSLAIQWRRDLENAPVNTTILAVPRLLVSSSEPRVLAAISYSATLPSMVHFDVTIENPSNHFLTFSLTMEPSEKFAFSGVKNCTLQLVPLSRRTMRFRLLPFVKGEWIGPVRCVVRDRYFQKVLKITPSEGMKAEKEGLLVWIPPEEEL